MRFIVGLVIGIIAACAIMKASKRFEEPKKVILIRSGIGLALITLAFTFAKKTPVLSVILFFVMAAAYAYIILWWHEEGSTIRELLNFVFIFFWVTVVMGACTWGFEQLLSLGILKAVFGSIPAICFFMSIGYMVADRMWFRDELDEH